MLERPKGTVVNPCPGQIALHDVGSNAVLHPFRVNNTDKEKRREKMIKSFDGKLFYNQRGLFDLWFPSDPLVESLCSGFENSNHPNTFYSQGWQNGVNRFNEKKGCCRQIRIIYTIIRSI